MAERDHGGSRTIKPGIGITHEHGRQYGFAVFKAINGGATENWGLLLLGTIVSAIVSFIAVKWLLRYVQSHTFIGFGVYRIILGLVLVWMFFSR
jgi:undecaprenyl pyrophosphate phosphatase UppP